jgi:hypothetical protein
MSAASGFWNGVNLEEGHRAQREGKERDEREAKLQTLISSGLPPAQVQQGIRDIYGQDAPALQRHVENLFRRVAGKQSQQAQAPMRAADLAGLEAQGKSLPQQQQDAYKGNLQAQQDAQLAGNNRTLQWYQGLTPEQQKAAQESGIVPGAPSSSAPYKEYVSPDGKQRDWFTVGKQPQGWNATGGMTKPVLPQLKQINGRDVLFDPTTQKIVKDFGPHGSVRVTNHQAIQTDADGTPHIVNLTSVSTPGGGLVQVDASESDEAQGGQASPAPAKHPAPHKATSSGATPAQNGDRTLPFQKTTPALTKAQNDVTEATKMASIAHQVAQTHDAFNQKRLLVALERASAGRFTVQALDYIKQAGWGNTLEEWMNKPGTGEIPADIVRQAVAGADENLKGAQEALNALKHSPAPKASSGGGKEHDPLGVL